MVFYKSKSCFQKLKNLGHLIIGCLALLPMMSAAIVKYDSTGKALRTITLKENATQFVYSVEQSLVNFVHKTITNVNYSSYKLGGTRFDPSRGVYVLDCSSFVDNLLQMICPRSYSNLVRSTGTVKPTSLDYYHFFSNLSEETNKYWNKIENITQLRPGDILVFRKKNTHSATTTGHVMVVMKKPVKNADGFMVRVADSAPIRHSQDTRERHTSGIGIGTLMLKVNPDTFRPNAYAWQLGAAWRNNVKIAMARPIGS